MSEAVAPSRRTRDVDLIVLDGPAASQSETPASVDDDPIVFRNLPFVVVRHAERWEHGASAVRRIELYPPSRLLWLLGLDWLISRQVDVINLSVGFLGEFDPSEPVHVATRTAVERHIVVVVAAGNEGPMPGTLQEVAQAEWVVAVGATDSGGELLESSSRGWPDGPWPAVVADGTDDVEPPMRSGTSFAAPRVAGVAAWLKRCLQLSQSNLLAALEDRWSPVTDAIALPRLGIADTGVDPSLPFARGALSGELLERGDDSVRLGRGDRERQWYGAVVEWLRATRMPCHITVTPNEVRRALASVALPVRGAETWEVGAGLVRTEDTERWLSALTPSRWMSIFCPTALSHETRGSLEALDARLGPLWEPDLVSVFKDLFLSGMQLFVTRVVA